MIPARTRRYSEVSLDRAVGKAADLAKPKITKKAKKLVWLFSFILTNKSVTILKSVNIM